MADRRLEVEAGLVEVLRDLQQELDDADLALRDITSRFIERHAEELERKITPEWVVRRRLGLRTIWPGGSHLIPASEAPRLEQLHEKYRFGGESQDLVGAAEPIQDAFRTSGL